MQLENPIKGSHISLRQMTEDDLAKKVQWYNDQQVRQLLILDETLDLEKTKLWFKTAKDLPTRIDLMIETNSNQPVGLISLVNIDSKNKTAEIFIVIGAKEFWGKGVMLEAESLLIEWAFSDLRLEKIWAQSRPENIASLITMKKLGFQIEGTLRQEKIVAGKRIDINQLGLLPAEFKPAQ